MSRNLSVGVLALVWTIPFASAQQTIVVTGGGQALANAIARAIPGDTLDVLPGVYDPIIVTKGIEISCRPGVVVVGTAAQTTAVDIRNVPANEEMVLRGGLHRGVVAFPTTNPVELDACAGTIVLDGIQVETNSLNANFGIHQCTGPVVVRGGINPRFVIRSSRIENSTQVSFQRCPNLAPIEIVNSAVVFNDSVIAPGNGQPGLSCTNSRVSIRGGRILSAALASLPAPVPGIRTTSTHLTLAGALLVRGDDGLGLGAPAISTTGGTVRVGPFVVLQPVAPAPPIDGSALVVREPVPSVDAVGVPPGGLFVARIDAAPGSLTATFLSPPIAPWSTPLGELWVDVASPVLDLGLVPAGGQRSVNLPVPPLPPNVVLALQPISLPSTGAVVIGVPTRVVLH